MASKVKNRYLRKNKTTRKIGWIKTNIYAKHYKRLDNYVRAVFNDPSSFQELKNRLASETPGIFDSPYSPLYGKYDDKKAILNLITTHAKQIEKDLSFDNHTPTHEQTLKYLLNTRTFVSQEELIQNNIKSFMKKRKNQDFVEKFRAELTKDLDPTDEKYLKKLKERRRIHFDKFTYEQKAYVKNIEKGTYDEVKAYIYETAPDGRKLALTMYGSGNKASPYVFKIEYVEVV